MIGNRGLVAQARMIVMAGITPALLHIQSPLRLFESGFQTVRLTA